ncbi:MAG: hypothetical protein V3V08_10795 [Nannocystaceae bacterium]
MSLARDLHSAPHPAPDASASSIVLERCPAIDIDDPQRLALDSVATALGAYRDLARKLVVLGEQQQAQQLLEIGVSLDKPQLFADWVLALSRTRPLEELSEHFQTDLRHSQCAVGRSILAGMESERCGDFTEAIDSYRCALESRSELMVAHRLCQSLHRAYRNAEMPAVYERHIFPALQIPMWQGDASIDKVDATHAIAVYFYGRGGSAFFNTLLDGHPDIIGPMEGFEHIGYFWKNGARSSPEAMIAMIAMPFHGIANLDGMFLDRQAGPAVAPETCRRETKLGRMRYLSAMQYIFRTRRWGAPQQMTGAQYMTALCLAYMIAQDRPFTNGRVAALFHAHHRLPTREKFIHDAFDNVRTVFCIRSPFQTLASHHQSSVENPLHDPAHVGSKHSFGVDLLNEYIEAHRAESSAGIRLEDLKYHAEPTLRSAAEHLHIAWDDCLMSSTVLGGPYTHVSANGERIVGFDPSPLKRKYTTHFSRLDELRIRLLMATLARQWGYSPSRWQTTALGRFTLLFLLWMPFRLERRQMEKSRQRGRPLAKVCGDAMIEYVLLRRLFLRKFVADLSPTRRIVRRLVPAA